jgi:predicted dehydrogenase
MPDSEVTHQIGIIGLGSVGTRFVTQFREHPRFDLVAAWDTSPEACDRALDDGVPVLRGAGEVIERSDVVYVAVPPMAHRTYVDQLITTGTAIFCEKPLGIDIDESRDLVRRVEESGLPAAVNFVYGSAPGARILSERIGDLGEIVNIEVRLHFSAWPRGWQSAATWLGGRIQGGWTREVLSHFVYLAHRMFGSVQPVIHEIGYPATGSEQTLTAHLDAGGVPMAVVGSAGGSGIDVVEFTVRGRHRSARLRDWYRLQWSDGTEPWVDEFTDVAALGPASYRRQCDNLARLLDGHEAGLPTFADAFAVQQVIEALLVP